MGILSKFWIRLVAKITGKHPGKIKKKWVFKTRSGILNSATISDIDGDGKKEILFGTDNGSIFALSDKGVVKWKSSVRLKLSKRESMFLEESTVNSIIASPAITRNKGKKIVIVCTVSGYVHALDSTGKKVWEYKTKGNIISTPLCHDINSDGDNEIIVGTSDNNLYALNNKGKLLWKFDAKSAITSPSAISLKKPKLIIFGTENGFVKAISTNGKFRWKFKTGDRVTAKPVISDIMKDGQDRIIIGSNDKSLYLLDKFGKVEWQYQTHGEIFSSVALGDVDHDNDKEIFFGCADDSIYALAPNSQKIWSYETDFWVIASPIITDIDNDGISEIIVGSYDKSLYVLEGKGTFALSYLPGISIIANQPGHFTPFITSQPGELVGNKLWKLSLGSVITGISLLQNKNETQNKNIIVSTKGGRLYSVYHEN